jgi:hypothetical protein
MRRAVPKAPQDGKVRNLHRHNCVEIIRGQCINRLCAILWCVFDRRPETRAIVLRAGLDSVWTSREDEQGYEF